MIQMMSMQGNKIPKEEILAEISAVIDRMTQRNLQKKGE